MTPVQKDALRRELLDRRRARPAAELERAGSALAAHTASEPLIARARRVAAYRSMRTEPPTAALIEALLATGREVLVPVIVADHQLDWEVVGAEATEHRGRDALATCDVVLAPALAADHAGHRLGRGAGYYDRALEGLGVPIVAVVFDDELLPQIPHEPHDVDIDAVLTPGGLFRVP